MPGFGLVRGALFLAEPIGPGMPGGLAIVLASIALTLARPRPAAAAEAR